MAELKDRVSASPGRRLIKPEADGMPDFYATIEMADEPTEPGNRINRQNVIDTLVPESDNGGVGTVIFTAISEPDDRWLPCDGRDIEAAADCAELRSLLTALPVQEQSMSVYAVDGLASVFNIKYINDCYVACGRTAAGAAVARADDVDGPWTAVQITTDNEESVCDVAYGNGCWVAVIMRANGSNVSYEVWHSTALDGTWAQDYTDAGSSINGTLRQVVFFNGSFYVFGGNVAYKTAAPANGWSSSGFSLWEGTAGAVLYNPTRGRWELAAFSSSGSTGNYTWYLRLYASANLLTWTAVGSVQTAATGKENIVAPGGCYLGVGNTYLNVFWPNGEDGRKIYGLNGSGIQIVPMDESASGGDYVRAGICDGGGEMLFKSSSYSDVQDVCFRQSAAGEFVCKKNMAVPGKVTTANYSGAQAAPLGGRVVLPASGNNLLVFSGTYCHYLPKIDPPDENSQVKAYIKKK